MVSTGPMSVSEADPRVGTVPLRPDLRPGTYTVSWKSVSTIDGHVLRGRYVFHLQRPTAQLPVEGGPSLPDAGLFTVAARGLRWSGLLLWLGAAFWLAMLLPAQAPDAGALVSRLARGAWWALAWGAGLAILGNAADLFSQALVVTGGQPAASASAAVWRGLLTGSRGALSALLELVTLPGLLLARRVAGGGAGMRLTMLVVGVALVGVRETAGHAAAASGPRTSAILLDWMHVVAAAYWVGGAAVVAWVLVPLWRADVTGEDRPALLRAIRAFSPGAALSFTVLVATGILQTELQVGSARALVGTAYGRVLATKLGLVGLLALVAGWQALGLRPAVARALSAAAAGPDGEPRATRRWLEALRFEPLLGLGILLLVGGLNTLTPAARAIDGPPAVPAPGPGTVVVAEQVGDLAATLALFPGRAGRNGLELRLVTREGAPAAGVTRVEVRGVQEASGEGTPPVDLERRGPSRFAGSVTLPAEGRWGLEVTAFRPGE